MNIPGTLSVVLVMRLGDRQPPPLNILTPGECEGRREDNPSEFVR